jgi:predicted outer membrane repeat protein
MPQSRKVRPQVECLEDRSVPSTFTVKNLNDSGTGSLREAIGAANALPNADTIVFKKGLQGTIVLTTGEISVTSNLTVLGPGASKIAISGNFANRVFNVDGGAAGADLTVKLQGLELRNGQTNQDGGAITCAENLTLTRMTITFNRGGYGGAIISTGDLKIVRSTISGNSAMFGAGGIYSDGTMTISASTISGNTAGSFGGGIACATATISGSTISGNTAAVQGGGIRIFAISPSEIRNSTISGNRAGINGGGILSNATSLRVRNCTISFNQAGQRGGGMANDGSSPFLESCLIADNTAGTGGKTLDNLGIGDVFHLDRCLISIYDGATVQDSGSNPIGPNNPGNNLFNIDARLAPLALNGGPTQTHALKKGSPAINKGSNPAGLTTDQRGGPFKRKLGSKVDIGAFERQ